MRPEHWLYTIPLRLRSLFRGRHVEQELDEELQFHLGHKIEQGIARGLSQKEARYAAMRAMEGLEQRKEEIRDMRGIHWLTDFVDDARFAIRSLRPQNRCCMLAPGNLFRRQRPCGPSSLLQNSSNIRSRKRIHRNSREVLHLFGHDRRSSAQ